MAQSTVPDRDPRFTTLFWRELASRLGTKLHMSTAYHPQSDGQAERVNGVLEDTLRQFVGLYQQDYDESASGVCFHFVASQYSRYPFPDIRRTQSR